MSLPTVRVSQSADLLEILLRTDAYSAAIVKILKGIPGARWDAQLRSWAVPLRYALEAGRAVSGLVCSYSEPSVRKAMVGTVEDLYPVAADRTHADMVEEDETLNGYPFKTKPFDHQRIAMVKAVKAKRFALLMEMGTGKTKTAIDTLSFWMKDAQIGGVLIFCPKAVLINWQREFDIHSPINPEDRKSIVMRGSSREKSQALREGVTFGAKVFITNYAALQTMSDELARAVHDKKLAVALDESTCVKNHASKTFKNLKAIAQLTQYKLILTGTPITQGPLDAWSQFWFLDPNIIGHHNYFSFKAEYAITGGFQGKQVIGYKNLDRLAKRIAPHSFRVLKKDCLDLPEKVYQLIELEMSGMQRTVYKEMKDDSIVEIEGHSVPAPVVLTKMLRLAQIAAGFLPVNDEYGKFHHNIEFEHPKLDACVEKVLEAIEGGKKAIVWCRFLWEVHKVEEMLREHTHCVLYYGDVSDVDRQRAVDEFQNSNDVRVFIGQIQTGGMAITLTKATLVCYLTNSFTLSDRLQSEDRAHRIGQEEKVTYIDFAVIGTLDKYVIRTLKNKKDVADVVNQDNIREVMGDA